MNQQEILKTLDLPFPCDFPKLAVLCQNPNTLEAVLSLAINQGKGSGMREVSDNYNQAFRRRGQENETRVQYQKG